MSRRILYILEPFGFPLGGVAVIYRHVELLNEAGIEAYVALPRQPDEDFYDTTAPLLLHGGDLPLQPGDICVVPEGFGAYFDSLQGRPVTVVMFCQNQFYLPFSDRLEAGKTAPPADIVVASSEAVRDFFADVYGIPDLPIIPCAIDTTIFRPGPAKKRQVAYMPRKLPDLAAFIKSVFKRKHPELASVPWVPIEGLGRAGVAGILAESAVFLSLSHRESLGLPPLEAMASGCLVAGFHGEGGKEFITPENGWWADDGDWRSCVSGLAEAFRVFDAGGEELGLRLAAAQATVARYSPDKMRSALLSFWEPLVHATANPGAAG